jgi:two-component system nitrogen regulation sensor histidine kinase NtrY
MGFLMINLVLVLALFGVIAKRVFSLVIARRTHQAGSRLQARIVTMFSFIAIAPTILVAIFSTIFFNYGIHTWFDNRVSTAILESSAVAEGYLEEHKKIIQADILGMANDLNREASKIRRSPQNFDKIVSILAGVRKLPEALVFQERGDRDLILGRSPLSFSLELVLEDISDTALARAAQGELLILTPDTEDRVIALIKLDNFFDTYLLVGRFVDAKIVNHIERTEGAVSQYQQLKANLSGIQVKFTLIFIVVSLLLLLAAIWGGMVFAGNLAAPLSDLINATARVKKGDLSARVSEGDADDEIASLTREFNHMTLQLERQRKELASAQRIAAWSDVARRIAHEIKNPLTPIQLASERLRRKYSNEVSDKETYQKYIDTIIRHVDDIGKMVEEFASFARMPAPIFAEHSLSTLLQDAIFSRECGQADITFKVTIPDGKHLIHCDASHIQQVFTNILKNAEEASLDAPSDKNKLISVTLEEEHDHYTIRFEDTGTGFPVDLIDRLTEPYVTTKSKGTGLGLTIVHKIIEDHGGTMDLSNTDDGACVTITLPKTVH